MPVLQPLSELRVPGDEEDLIHIYCECSPKRSLCGLDLSDYDEDGPPEDVDCVVCAMLEEFPCERCGV